MADGLALLRAATFRTATNALMEAAAAAEEEEEGGAGSEEAWERSSESDDGRGGTFTVDALTLLAESSSEAAACRSPRMLEAAIAMSGALGF